MHINFSPTTTLSMISTHSRRPPSLSHKKGKKLRPPSEGKKISTTHIYAAVALLLVVLFVLQAHILSGSRDDAANKATLHAVPAKDFGKDVESDAKWKERLKEEFGEPNKNQDKVPKPEQPKLRLAGSGEKAKKS